jgi:hypothetical protein
VTKKVVDVFVFFLIAPLRWYISEKHTNCISKSVSFQDLFAANANNTRQFTENSMQFAGVEGHLLEKKWRFIRTKGRQSVSIRPLNTRFEVDNQINLSQLLIKNSLKYVQTIGMLPSSTV